MAEKELPPVLRLTLRSGTVYYFQHRVLRSAEPHFFAVINANPLHDNILLLAVGSSQVAKICERRAGLPDESLVVVEPTDYDGFSKTTVIDCNQVFEIGMAELVQKFQEGELRHHPDLPKTVMEQIWAGVRASPLVDNNHKKLLPPE